MGDVSKERCVEMSSGNVSKVSAVVGWVLGVLPCLLMVGSAAGKLAKMPDVVKGFGQLGYPEHLIRPIGIVELCCAVLYLIPKTGVLGAILVTAYLGGAVATHVRAEQPVFFAPALLGVVAWLGIYLRDRRVRELVPIWK
jgi:hypothetical protein